MTFKLSIRCENAAFEDEPMTEVSRILTRLAKVIERDGDPEHTLFDINGNRVGKSEVVDD